MEASGAVVKSLAPARPRTFAPGCRIRSAGSIGTVSIGMARSGPPRGHNGPAEYAADTATDTALDRAKHSGHNTLGMAQPRQA